MRFGKGLLLITVLGLLAAACGTTTETQVSLAPLSDLPMQIREAPVAVQEAYRFALANQDLLQRIPCYCGCGAMGHTSNYDCYVSGSNADGRPIFDYHGFG